MKEINQNRKGLYTPSLESDSCGVGLIADLTNRESHHIIDSALTMLERMEHRGACGYEPNTGDGAGILCQIPHSFFRELCLGSTINLPEQGTYGVGMFFFPRDPYDYENCYLALKEHTEEWGFKIILERDVPTDNTALGESARSSEPIIKQLLFKYSKKNDQLERSCYLFRCSLMKYIYGVYPELIDEFYIPSLSSKTIIYKGLLMATQLRGYFKDLQKSSFASAVAVVHSRFSTNTDPKWKLAQPFRVIAHNGEINTIKGNINWWEAREKYLKHHTNNKKEYKRIFPICDPYISDSGNFDNVIEFLSREKYSIPHTLMMMIPEAWQSDTKMEAHKKAFYEYHDGIMEPWDGPACICFTDGTLAGATLDRNGLRPARYAITNENILVLASEAGCINIDPSTIVQNGRLEPGKMLLADLSENRILSDQEIKDTICKKSSYEGWIEEQTLNLKDIPSIIHTQKPIENLQQQQTAFGMSIEDEQIILKSMMNNSAEPIGSMGADIPLAVLSKKAQHISNYFKQQFAQVTNPPIDSIREKYFMSLITSIGAGSEILSIGKNQAQVIRCPSPVLTEDDRQKLINCETQKRASYTVNATYKIGVGLQESIRKKCAKLLYKIEQGNQIICVSHKSLQQGRIHIPSLLMVGAIHQICVEKGVRKEITIIVEAGDVWETHHYATLLSYGADLVSPYLAFETVEKWAIKEGINVNEASAKYKKAVEKGLLKIMSKIGISTLASYKGAQTFEALGISDGVIQQCFKGTISRIGGLDFNDLERENLIKHEQAFKNKSNQFLPDQGIYRWRKNGEYHLFNPTTIHLLQHSTRTKNYQVYKKFADEIDTLETNSGTLRSFIGFKWGNNIPLKKVESASSIMKRFVTGAMSFGSISEEAHEMLAVVMNRIGGKSNSGEGGEDDKRFVKMDNGDWKRSAIKQVASGRFGVNIHYLSEAAELQIKMAQGAKPGEGGQLPGHKVDANIARVRNSTPGVGLISPPPHHDIYSIEDLAQLIYDLKNANQKARISVKLVSKAGVGVIASGVTKAHADHILISGCDGGTGASPLSSIRHAGLPWELGLAETHQTLVKNGLRDRVVLQTDGQIRTGRDMAIATMLGAEEWGIATAALVVEGCILMRKCHLNTCPVGIATQDKELRKNFNGKIDHLINYFNFLAEHLREIMSSLGIRKVNQLVGRSDLLEIRNLDQHWKTENLELDRILFQEENLLNETIYASKKQDHQLKHVLDRVLIEKATHAIHHFTPFSDTLDIKNTDRAVGTMLSHEITKKYGAKGVTDRMIHFKFNGSAGQSFGAFGANGLMFSLEGESNDYFGKGLSGATLAVQPNRNVQFQAEKNIIVGNVALYGATSGEAYINGQAGDRFSVRNSGALAVVEGIGDNGCEYMTGGKVVILGAVGRNFAAGMSGGLAYIYQHATDKDYLINQEMVTLEKTENSDLEEIKQMIQNHLAYTNSSVATKILGNWEIESTRFIKVYPIEYKKAIEKSLSLHTHLRKVV